MQFKIVAQQTFIATAKNQAEAKRRLRSECEFDGWAGEWKDCLNFHNRVKGTNRYRVNFVRWVEE